MTLAPYFDDGQVRLHLGDCLDVLPTLPDASVDAVVTDPPYGLSEMSAGIVLQAIAAWMGGDRTHVPDGRGFMGRNWDAFVPPPGVWDECMRVLKPGGHLLAFAAPRTADLMTLSIRIAGFEIRDGIDWIFGQGYPKSLDISKAIDKQAVAAPLWDDIRAHLRRWINVRGMTNAELNLAVGGATNGGGRASAWLSEKQSKPELPSKAQWVRLREVLRWDDCPLDDIYGQVKDGAERPVIDTRTSVRRGGSWAGRERAGMFRPGETAYSTSGAATEDAGRWDGWGTALKPAHEPIVVARKPFTGTVAANVLEHGTGALNIGACRTGTEARVNNAGGTGSLRRVSRVEQGYRPTVTTSVGEASEILGRWPTNLVFSHSPRCELVGEQTVKGDTRSGQARGTRPGHFAEPGADSGSPRPNGHLYGDQVVPVFQCGPGCPVAELDQQSGVRASGANPTRRGSDKSRSAYGEFKGGEHCTPARGADSGGASRYFPTFRYEPKAPASERPRVNGIEHVSVKPLTLMRWLVRLVTPSGGTVLDLFAGSGTTLEAAALEDFNAIGIEREPEYAALCVARLTKPLQPSLFGIGGEFTA